jgi:hypothetical protein
MKVEIVKIGIRKKIAVNILPNKIPYLVSHFIVASVLLWGSYGR